MFFVISIVKKFCLFDLYEYFSELNSNAKINLNGCFLFDF